MNIVKMYGPSISDPTKIVNRDVPENDVGAYERAGYKKGEKPSDDKDLVAVKKTDSIPESFPGHSALLEAGITTFAELDAVEDITEILGIGNATAKKIAEARQ